MKKNIEPAAIASLTMTIQIGTSPDNVWRALTENIGEWWPADFYAGGADGKRDYHLEASPGGRMFESWDGGGGVLWGTVVCVNPGKQLQVLGAVFPSFGGPSEWFGTWSLEKAGANQTTLTFSESSLGRVSDEGTQEKDAGWSYLWNTLKAHLEGTTSPGWAD